MPGFAEFINSVRGGPEDKPDALTRARLATDRPDEPYDDDERQAGLMARGYTPGATLDLNRRLAEKSAELAGEREKIANGEKATARVRGMLERGQIGALDAHRMMDGDFGDANRAANLKRQCANLERQIADASAAIAPQQQRDADPYEAANRAAHELFREVTRQRMTEVQAGRPAARPFGSASRGGVAVRSEVTCEECIAAGATPDESFLIHADPQPVQFTDEDMAEYARQTGQTYRPAERRGQGSRGLAVR